MKKQDVKTIDDLIQFAIERDNKGVVRIAPPIEQRGVDWKLIRDRKRER